MIMRWLAKATTESDKEKLTTRIISCKEVLDILSDMLQEDRDKLIREMLDKDSYKNPAWNEYHADRLGSIRTLDKVIKYLEV